MQSSIPINRPDHPLYDKPGHGSGPFLLEIDARVESKVSRNSKPYYEWSGYDPHADRLHIRGCFYNAGNPFKVFDWKFQTPHDLALKKTGIFQVLVEMENNGYFQLVALPKFISPSAQDLLSQQRQRLRPRPPGGGFRFTTEPGPHWIKPAAIFVRLPYPTSQLVADEVQEELSARFSDFKSGAVVVTVNHAGEKPVVDVNSEGAKLLNEPDADASTLAQARQIVASVLKAARPEWLGPDPAPFRHFIAQHLPQEQPQIKPPARGLRSKKNFKN